MHKLRPYQKQALDLTYKGWERGEKVLLVLATGLGKTIIACELMGQKTERSLFLVHTNELVKQTAKQLHDRHGRHPEIEKAESYADPHGDRDVVASVQSLRQKGRLERFAPDCFGRIITDEAHHSRAPSYGTIYDHFKGAKMVGFTATPRRTDKKALGKIWTVAPLVYPIGRATADGWLCPMRVQHVTIEGLDISMLKAEHGDFDAKELEQRMLVEEVVCGIAQAVLDHCGDRQAIIFCAGVEQAKQLAAKINSYARETCAAVIHQKSPKAERDANMKAYKEGRLRYLTNFNVLTEGVDAPRTYGIVIARGTKSPLVLTQMIGRGTRTDLPRNALNDAKDADERCRLIADSAKPYGLVLDFKGKVGRHKLATIEDALGGDYNDHQKAMARRIRAKEGVEDVHEALELAKADLELYAEVARMNRDWFTPKVRYSLEEVDLYGHTIAPPSVVRDTRATLYDTSGPATTGQLNYIRYLGRRLGRKVDPEWLRGLSKRVASGVIGNWKDG